MHERILEIMLRRDRSLFTQDMDDHHQDLMNEISNARVLVIGAAGSIGSAFVKQVAAFTPAALHLVDINENNLVEVVRDLRSTNLAVPDDFKTYAIGLGSIEFEAFIRASREYDYIVNFSALKHVRSERDPYTLMRMIHTNLYSLKQLSDHLAGCSTKKLFSVSSDKAVNPVSIMGATKAFMEKIMIMYSDKTPCSSSRFANVAFSDGSLLFGFDKRLQKKQPISAPSDVKRFFISHEEAGSLCLLSCFLGGNRDNYFPKLNEDLDMYTFSEIAEIFLRDKGLKPVILASEEEAKDAAARMKRSPKEWPCYFSGSDTTGEKMYEEFYTEDDDVDFDRYTNIGVIRNTIMDEDESIVLQDALEAFRKMQKRGTWSKEEIVDCMKTAIHEMQHEEMDRNLDQKM